VASFALVRPSAAEKADATLAIPDRRPLRDKAVDASILKNGGHGRRERRDAAETFPLSPEIPTFSLLVFSCRGRHPVSFHR